MKFQIVSPHQIREITGPPAERSGGIFVSQKENEVGFQDKEQRMVAEDGVDERCDDADKCDDADRGVSARVSFVPFSLCSDGDKGWRR
ncbi:hypothetical protein Q3G72_024818 [Acer saccharum]|nr:hypothetical protein Q3G72_024818 [Acer saccharum]